MRRSLKKTISLLLCVAVLLSLCACNVFTLTDEEKEELAEDDAEVIVGQSIGQALVATYAADDVFSLNSVPTASFNPYSTTSAWNEVVGMLVYEDLVVEDGDFEVSPNLITAWSSEDGINWTFTVDTTRSFHDGGKMTAADAVYTIQQAMAVGGAYETRFRNIKEISTIDTSTFTVTLSEANARFYTLLNIPCIEYGCAYEEMPPGTGVYMFNEDATALILNEEHPKASEMPLDNIYLKEYSAAEDILQAFEDSYIDLVINDPTAMSNLGYSSTNIIKYVDSTHLHYLGYNTVSGLFAQSAYRTIMTYAIDRASIVSDVMSGAAVAATLPVHPNNSLYLTSIASDLNYSQDGFETALKNLGAQDVDGDGYLEFGGLKYSITFLVCSDSAAKVSAARAIVSDLESFGFEITLRELNYEDYSQALQDGEFDIYYGEVRLCLDWDISLLVGSGGQLNYGGCRDASLDAYLSTFLRAPSDQLEYSAEQLYMYLAQSAPITPICFEKHEVLYHRGVLANLSPTQDDIFYGMENWTVDLTQ